MSSSSSTNNTTGMVGGSTSGVGGESGVTESSYSAYDSNGDTLRSVNEHWTGSAWVTDSSDSAAYSASGTQCWSSPTTVADPSCSSPPTGTATVDYDDPDGNLVAQVDPGGSGVIGTSGHCNPLAAFSSAYLINTSDLCAFTTYDEYNEAGELIETIEPSASNSTTGYVAAGITTTYGYDPSGNQTTEVNPAGNTVTSTFDGSGRLVGISQSDQADETCSAGGSEQQTCYSYNADSTRSQMIDSTGTSTYAYNAAGLLTSVTDSNGNTITYGYDSFGQKDCISYPGFPTAYSCLSSGNPDNGTNAIDPGEVWYSYDQQGRLQTVLDWNGDAFTYGYDCTGDVAWLAETPATQAPSVTECAGAAGTVPAAPAPTSSGTTYVVTTDYYGSGTSGNLLSSQETNAVTSSGSTSLLEFDSLAYDENDDLTSETPKVSGTTETADTYNYDSQQRVTSGPETSGSKTSYSYVNSTGTQPFTSANTADQMGIDAMPDPGSSAQLGAEYAGNGELCWIGQVTSSTGTCNSPSSSATNYETFAYDVSGNVTGTSVAGSGYGSTSSYSWNVDTGTLSCVNTTGSTCTTPASSTPNTSNYTYNGDGLRMTAQSWNGSSVSTAEFTWDTTTSALLSNGTIDYLYGANPNVPVAQIDVGDSVTAELLTDPSSNVRGIVEVSATAANPYVLDNYSDYDAYGNPMTKSGGSVNTGGLLNEGISGDPDSKGSFGFGGGYGDGTGFIYLVNRYYEPATGQFISIDPDAQATNTPYSYAGDDALNASDPNGLRTTVTRQQGMEAIKFAMTLLNVTPYYFGAKYNHRLGPAPGQTFPASYLYCTGKSSGANGHWGTVIEPGGGGPAWCDQARWKVNGPISHHKGAKPGFDCSGLTEYVWHKIIGQFIGTNTWDQIPNSKQISKSMLQPGDLVFYDVGIHPLEPYGERNGHVALWVGPGKLIEALDSGSVVTTAPVNNPDVWNNHDLTSKYKVTFSQYRRPYA